MHPQLEQIIAALESADARLHRMVDQLPDGLQSELIAITARLRDFRWRG